MKQVIFLSTFFSFISFFVNYEEVLAAGPAKPNPGAPPPAKGPAKPGPNVLSPIDPRLHPQKYCISRCAPTVVPKSPFDPIRDSIIIHDAMKKAYGTNEEVLINILTTRSNPQRQEIAEAYTKKYRGDVLKTMRGETSGGFESVLAALMTPFPVYLAKELHNNIGQKGTDELMMVENLCSLNNYGIKSMAEIYQSLYRKPLQDDVKAETTGSLQKIMMSSVQGKRDENQNANNPKAVADAQTLHKTKGPKWLADNSEFNTILGTRSFAQLKQIFVEYKKISGQEIEVDIEKEFKGNVGKGLLAFVKCARSKAAFLAERLHHSMKGLGTKEATLTRVIVSRCEIDLADIKNTYQSMYGKPLRSWIDGDTSGDYGTILLALLTGRGNVKK